MSGVMEAFVQLQGVAAALPLPHLDTDQIMPKQFLRGIDRQGLSAGVLYELRFDPAGKPRTDFVLNQAPWNQASILVVGPNFGCGSSREHAVWGLRELGIRCMLGTSFGGIIADNCLRNGVPALSLSPEQIERLTALVQNPTQCELRVDLPTQTVTSLADNTTFHVELDPWQRDMLIQGLDPVGMTLTQASAIRDFEARYLHHGNDPGR
jgi:3-isopropylmalate/(R)-2-methylmalate dehydratase small subunit